MMCTPEQRDAYYDAVAAEQQADCAAIEERCEHLEAIVNSTTSLLRLVIKDFQSPYLKPIFDAPMARLNSVAAFMETALKCPPNPNK
jgi:hypothetical protein